MRRIRTKVKGRQMIKMKFPCIFLALFTGTGLLCADSRRENAVTVLKPGRVTVVAAEGCAPAVGFAAGELTNFLSRVLGAQVPVVTQPDDTCGVNVILGDNEWSRAEKLNPATLVRDLARLQRGGFVIRKVRMIDMFPRSGHFETFVQLNR